MDIFSHAVAGASVGYAFGRPLLGAVFGVLPDVFAGIRRRITPTALYDISHSAIPVAILLVAGLGTGEYVPALAVLSHILLDLPTHGPVWAPPIALPFSKKRFSFGDEWEWLNWPWWKGLGLTLLWSLTWLTLAFPHK